METGNRERSPLDAPLPGQFVHAARLTGFTPITNTGRNAWIRAANRPAVSCAIAPGAPGSAPLHTR